jgi:hypothetical protein
MSGLVAASAATVHPYQQGAFLYKMPEFKSLEVFNVDFDTSKPLLHRLGVQMQSTLIVYHGTKETGRLETSTS